MSVTDKQVAALYVAVFNRAPDQAGLNYWVDTDDFETVANGFVGHPVFEEKYGEMNSEEFITAIYQNILGGEGDVEGIEHWVGRLENDGWSRAEVLAQFINETFNYEGDDAEALVRKQFLENKVDVALYYTETLGEASNLSPDTDFDSVDVVNDPVYQQSQEILAGVDASEASVEAAKAEIDVIAEGDGSEGLVEVLAGLQAAQDEVDSFLETWGEANDVENATATDVNGAVTEAVKVLNNEEFDAKIGFDDESGEVTDTTAQVEAKIALAAANLDSDLASAQTALNKATTAINEVTGLKVRVDNYVRAFDTAQADAAAKVTADNALTGALTQFELDQDEDDLSIKGEIFVDNPEDPVAADAGYKDGDLVLKVGDDIFAAYNGTKWVAVENEGEISFKLTPAVEAAGEAFYDAATTAADSLDAAQNALNRIVALEDEPQEYVVASEVDLKDEISAAFNTDSDVFAYVTKAADLADAKETLEAFNEAVATYNAAAADAAELASLEKAVKDATKDVQDAGFEPFLIGTDLNEDGEEAKVETDFIATDGNDVFVLTAAAATEEGGFRITDFGFLGNDFLDVSGYTRGDIDAGDNSVLEYFIEAKGNNAVITFETSEFGSNAATSEVFTITLVGVNAEDLVQTGDFLTV